MAGFDLVVLRHGRAAPPRPGVAEEERPLLAEGAREFRLAARGLALILRPPLEVRSSPLKRSLETAVLLLHALQEAGKEAWAATPDEGLRPESPVGPLQEEILAQLGRNREGTLVLVTHQPLAGDLVGQLLAAPSLPFHPGEACSCRLGANGIHLEWKLPAPLAAMTGGSR